MSEGLSGDGGAQPTTAPLLDPAPARRAGGAVAVAMGLGATALLHGAIVVVVLLGRLRAEANAVPPLLQGQVVDVQAVKFGKPRDLSFLPHKEAVHVSKGPKPKIALTENERALPRLKDPNEKPPDLDDPLKRTRADQFKNLTDQPEQQGIEEEGDPNGVRGGTATVGRGPIYYQHLQAAVQNAWNVPPTIRDEQLAKLKAMACVKIDASGKITEVGIRVPSGNDRFDDTLLAALRSIETFEPPTPDVKDAVTTDGVCMNFAKTR